MSGQVKGFLTGEGVSRRVRERAGSVADVRPATVSVVIPCYNYGRYLPQAVASALDQDRVSVDVIVVDDASTDDSLAVARSLLDDRVRVVAQPQNSGPVATFNRGLAEARGEFLVRLDADDMLTPGSLARSVALAQRHPSVGLVYGHPLHFSGEAPRARTRATEWTVWPGREWLRMRCERGTNVITSPEVLMRSSVVAVVGGQNDLAHSHDMEMWLRIAAVSDVGYVGGADQAWHREHDRSLSALGVDMVSDLYDRRDAFTVLFDGPAANLDGSGEMLETARRALAREALSRACHEYDRGRGRFGAVAPLIAFALETYPPCRETRHWRALERRMALARISDGVPWLAPAAVGRRVRHEWDYRRWARRGT